MDVRVIKALNMKERILREWKKLIANGHQNTTLERYGDELIIKDEDTDEILLIIDELYNDDDMNLFAWIFAL